MLVAVAKCGLRDDTIVVLSQRKYWSGSPLPRTIALDVCLEMSGNPTIMAIPHLLCISDLLIQGATSVRAARGDMFRNMQRLVKSWKRFGY